MNTNNKNKGINVIAITLVSGVVTSVVALGLSKVYQADFLESNINKKKIQAEQLALDRANIIRSMSYDVVDSTEKKKIDAFGNDDRNDVFYEEVISLSNSNDKYKELKINIYHNDSTNPLTSLVIRKMNPGNLIRGQIVPLDIVSDVKAYNKDDAFTIASNKFSEEVDSESTDKAFSIDSLNKFLTEVLSNYQKNDDSVKRPLNSAVGSVNIPIFVDSNGESQPGFVDYRIAQNLSSDKIAVIVKENNNYYIDYITKKEFFKDYYSGNVNGESISGAFLLIPQGNHYSYRLVLKNTSSNLPMYITDITKESQIIKLPKNTDYDIEYIPDTGYNLSFYKDHGTVIDSVVSAAQPKATLKKFLLEIVQIPHQTITVTANGMSYTSNVELDFGTVWNASVTPDVGYEAGSLIMSSGTITENTTVSASEPNLKKYRFTITQSGNQTIKVVADGKTYTSSFTVPYGTRWTASVSPNTGYNAGSLNSTSGVVSADVSVYASNATKKVFTVTIKQSANQTIKVVADGKTYTSSFTVPYGTRWTASVSPNTGYNAGSLNSTSGVITSDITVSASEASVKYYVVTLQPYSIQQGICFRYGSKVAYANGRGATTVSVPYGTSWTATACKNSSGYNWDNYGQISPTSGVITGNVTIKGISSPYDYSSGGGSGCGAEGCGGESSS